MKTAIVILLIAVLKLPLAIACISLPPRIALDDATFDDALVVKSTNLATGNEISLEGKFRTEKSGRIRISKNTSDQPCVQFGIQAMICGHTKLDEAVLDAEGKVVGLISVESNDKIDQVRIYSVNGNSEKDLKLPYMTADFANPNFMTLEAKANGEVVGKLESTRQEHLGRSMQIVGKAPLQLNGFAYTRKASDSCSSGIEDKPFERQPAATTVRSRNRTG